MRARGQREPVDRFEHSPIDVNATGPENSGHGTKRRTVMPAIRYGFESAGEPHSLDMVLVDGTRGRPYRFGEGDESSLLVEVPDFYIATTPVTVALWSHVAGDDPSVSHGSRKPVENISWNQITGPGGFLDRLNASPVLRRMAGQLPGTAANARFRLPSETEWE